MAKLKPQAAREIAKLVSSPYLAAQIAQTPRDELVVVSDLGEIAIMVEQLGMLLLEHVDESGQLTTRGKKIDDLIGCLA